MQAATQLGAGEESVMDKTAVTLSFCVFGRVFLVLIVWLFRTFFGLRSSVFPRFYFLDVFVPVTLFQVFFPLLF